jgi:glycosyltransferase involved in cell wall biosynthesis
VFVLSHPTGNANLRAVAEALHRHGLLDQFHTTLADGAGLTGRLLASLAAETSARRRFALPAKKIHLHPWRELFRQIAPKVGLAQLVRHEYGWASIDRVYQSLDRAVAQSLESSGVSGVYQYEDGALQTFTAATRLGLTCAYDLPIAYWRLGRAIQEEEAALRPEWAMTLEALCDSSEKLERKDRELALADAVFCASTFTARSLDAFPGGLGKPVHQVAYGSPTRPLSQQRRMRPKKGPLQLLFVGGLSQRKGLSYLFAAVELLGQSVELTVIGRRPKVACPALDRALAKHRHIESLPHSGILEAMEASDLFVFPSIFEGFGLVLLEAMGRGVPCITTPNTAGPDIITDGVDGYIVPIRDVDAIVGRVEYLRQDRDALAAMSAAALATSEKMTWECYGNETVQYLQELGAVKRRG